MHHGIIITGGNVNVPVGMSGRPIPIRGTGAHRIASHMRGTGEWDIEVVDYTEAWSIPHLKQFIESRVSSKTKFVACSTFFTFSVSKQEPVIVPRVVQKQNAIMKFVKQKYPHITTLVGGNKLVNLLHHECDYHVVGQGEHAMVALCDHLIGKNLVAPKVKVVRNPYNFIFKAYDREYRIIDAKRDYPAFPLRHAKTLYEERDFIQPDEVLTTELARGCKFKCTFCDYDPLGVKGDQTRDAQDFREELIDNYERWGVTKYLLTDETSNDSTSKIKKFAEVAKSLPFQPQFHGFVRADLLTSRKDADWDNMLDMGFTSMGMGVESFNHASGKSIKKGMDPLRIKEGLLESEEYFRANVRDGNHYAANLTMIAGLPHETYDTLDETERWLNKYWKNQVGMNALYISEFANKDPNGFDAVSEFEKDPGKYGYTFRNKTFEDKITERYYWLLWDAKSPIPENPSMLEMRNYLNPDYVSSLSKQALSNTHNYDRAWVHPSDDYDWIDMVEWSARFQSNRVKQLNRPEGQSGWNMGWYNQLGYDLRDVYSGNPPIVTENDFDNYQRYIRDYIIKKLDFAR